METITTEQAFLSKIKDAKKIIVIERKHTARTVGRYIYKNGFEDKVECFSAFGKEKSTDKRLNKPFIKISELENHEDALFVAVQLRDGSHEIILEKLKEINAQNIALVDFELYASFAYAENPDVDFMCPGFTKCGTSSLCKMMRADKRLFFPKIKETLYLLWNNKYEDSPERFKKLYFSNVGENKIVGNIEPAYHRKAREIYECFGKDVKLIFLLRNPADATYSYYRMLMRTPRKRDEVEFYKHHLKYCLKMFDEFIEDRDLIRFHYEVWINEFLEYFPKEQIKIMFFEDLIADTNGTMNELQKFIGLDTPYDYQELPHENNGNMVSKNYISALINFKYYWLQRESKEGGELSTKKKKFYEFAKKAQKYTSIDTKQKMTDEQRKKLNVSYADTIKAIEEMTGRSLTKLWKQDI